MKRSDCGTQKPEDIRELSKGIQGVSIVLLSVRTGKLLQAVVRIISSNYGIQQQEIVGTRSLGKGTQEISMIYHSTQMEKPSQPEATTERFDCGKQEPGKHQRTLKGHIGRVNSVAFSPNGKTIISGGDQSIRLWSAKTGRHQQTLMTPRTRDRHTGRVYSVVFSPDEKTIASGSEDKTVRLWYTGTGLHKQTLHGHDGPVYSVAFSPDGKIIASASTEATETIIRLWHAETGVLMHTLDGHTKQLNSIPFSPDGKTIAGGSWESTIHLWETATGKLKQTLTGTGDTGHLNSVSFSPNGRTLVSASADGMLLLWDVAASVINAGAAVSLLPASVQLPAIGQKFTLSLNITDGESVAGYQATVRFDPAALRYIESRNGDYLPKGTFFVPPIAESGRVTLAAASLSDESKGDGTLVRLTFEVIAAKASDLNLSDVILTDTMGVGSQPRVETAKITELPAPVVLKEDINGDGVVDNQDLELVAANFGQQGKNRADVNGDGVVNVVDLTLVEKAINHKPSEDATDDK